MRLLHYSNKKVTEAKNGRRYLQKAEYKPKGLWVSVEGEDDWKWWCEAEQFNIEQLSVVHEVALTPKANILYLRCGRDLYDFTGKYMQEIYPGQGLDPHHCGIDWKTVAAHYQGIIIAPYIWDCRLKLMWYYGWDCASGCIWDTAAIQSITAQPHLEEVEDQQRTSEPSASPEAP